jgi:hypothetical protein
MKWMILFALLFSVSTAEIAAQEVNASALSSATSLSAAFPAPRPQPRPQTINDDDVRGTWELGSDTLLCDSSRRYSTPR